MRFAGFIMTYNRPAILQESISRIFKQTLPPEKLFILDNSDNDETFFLISKINSPSIIYHRMGYNAGPAGAAKIGLQKLTEEGFDWIYWGDDDDPPPFSNAFEQLLNNIEDKAVGIVGVTGCRFSRLTGQLIRISKDEIGRALVQQQKWIAVDSIAGNQSMIVNAEVVKNGILPDPKLFFGFEELDFCLKVKKRGFSILASADLFSRSRIKFQRVDFHQPLYIPFAGYQLKRQYFSFRNGIYILISEKLFFALFLKILKGMLKIPVGYFKGLNFGHENSKMILKGIWDGWFQRFNNRNFCGKV